MSRVIVVTSGKGGVGKSSVSVNLASALAFSKFKVCLIDGDFGLKNLDVMMGLENRVVYDLNDVVEGRCTIEQVLVKDKRIDGLSLLPSCKSLSFENLDTEIMNSLIERLNKDYDFIIVDSPAGVEKGFQYSASLANEAIVVVNLDVSSLRDADRVVGLLMKKGINTINMIINKVNVDDIPIATVPEKSVNDAISIAIIAIDKEGINIFNPNFSAFKVANVSSNCFNVPMFICLVAESTAITITSAPTI